jgi:seryl-tRNA synthetase
MLDIKEIRENKEAIETRLRTKEPSISLDELVALDTKLRELKTEVEALKSQRNEASKKIGEIKRTGGDVQQMMKEVGGIGDDIKELDEQVRVTSAAYEAEISKLPNLPAEKIKISQDPADNVEIKHWGDKTTFGFTPKNHVELNEIHNLFDFVRGAKISGAGWPIYRGMGARLEWALINYMYDVNIKNGFEPWMLPLCVSPEAMYGVGQLPKFANQLFHIQDEDYDLYMIPTAEAALNGLHMDEVFEEEELPKRYMSYTPCFRREAGAAGSKERGLIRVHQFNKVEMFSFCTPEQGSKMMEMMLANAEEILQGLGLHYRNMLLVTGDMSFASSCTIDIEVWLPGQDRYYEVSSVSHCTDYQARRSRIRYRPKSGGKPELVHTLNGSGLATSRLMVSLLENNQQPDGSIKLPKVLAERLGTDVLKA